MTIRAAAEAVLRAMDAERDAMNGLGHPGEAHDRILHEFRPGAEFEFFDIIGDCASCGGAQHGASGELNMAVGDLRAELGQERKPWEARTQEQTDRAVRVAMERMS